MGRSTNTARSPRDSSRARRKFSSTIGPNTKPSKMGATENSSVIRIAPITPNANTSHIWKRLFCVLNTPTAMKNNADGNR
ncbi:hypothetical protein D3C87_2036170 [compost metagenome]